MPASEPGSPVHPADASIVSPRMSMRKTVLLTLKNMAAATTNPPAATASIHRPTPIGKNPENTIGTAPRFNVQESPQHLNKVHDQYAQSR